jgi:hypothetical protein
MALRAVPDHPKFARLKTLVHAGKAATLGYLECMWHFCGRFTPQGNIGKYADADIEAWLEWDGDEGALIAAFVRAGWLEESADYRLIVHDWHCHADDATRKTLSRSHLEFVTRHPDTIPTLSRHCPDSVAPVSGPPVPEPGAGPEINTHSAREILPEEAGPDPRQVTAAIDQWHRYLREKWEEFPDSADVKYDAETLRRFCREHPTTKPADHVAYSIQRKAKTLQPKFPKLPAPTNGSAGRAGLNATDTRARLRANLGLDEVPQ